MRRHGPAIKGRARLPPRFSTRRGFGLEVVYEVMPRLWQSVADSLRKKVDRVLEARGVAVFPGCGFEKWHS